MKPDKWVKQFLKLNTVKKTLIIGFLLCILAIVSVSGVTLAKYYAKRDNKGVSVASGLYFNSNCISNVEGAINVSLDQIDLLQVPGYVNPEGGTGAGGWNAPRAVQAHAGHRA